MSERHRAVISRLRLRRFRNYEALDLNLGGGLTLFVGANGEGKTNILEGIHFLALLRSFRTHEIATLTQWDADGFYLECVLGPGAGDAAGLKLSAGYGERRVLRCGGETFRRSSEFINRFVCVALVPEDIDLVKGTAAVRRRFLDIFLSQWQPGYLASLQSYQEALRRRNAILKGGDRYPVSARKAYDRLLVQHGAAVERVRLAFLRALKPCLRDIGEDMTSACGQVLQLRFSPNALPGEGGDVRDEDLEALLEASLERSQERDLRDGYTHQGPHRDDFSFLLGERDLFRFGSEGECRLACIALRLASVRMLIDRRTSSQGVVVLVDDVMGELDKDRCRRFFDVLADVDQVLMTVTEMPPEDMLVPAAVVRVDAGRVETT